MKFIVRSPEGKESEVELAGPVVVLGRDPSCDILLNDPKCSRRHAIVEAVPEGISIRDNGSANGVFVNGKQVERAILNGLGLERLDFKPAAPREARWPKVDLIPPPKKPVRNKMKPRPPKPQT